MKHILACAAIVLFLTLARAEDPWTPSSLCPYPSEDLTREPYEGDCTKYWECFEGARYVMTCPEGLEFNDETKRCDTPESAQCDADATVIYPTYPHTVDPTASTETPFEPDPMCPYPSEVLVYFPYPLNCSQYWECFEGHKYLMSCPEDLYWNIDYDYCDYLENVDCDRNAASTTTSTTPTPTTSGETTTGGTGTTEPTTTSGPTEWTPDPLCPYPSEELAFFPNADNCSQYWECYEGNKYLMSCPNGLYWNELANVCDYLENVNCDRASTTTTTVVTTITTPEPTNTTDTSETDTTTVATTTTALPTSPAVQCVNTPDGTYFADPTDCTKYYECVAGKGISYQCPSNLYWNQASHTCDYPENVTCTVISR